MVLNVQPSTKMSVLSSSRVEQLNTFQLIYENGWRKQSMGLPNGNDIISCHLSKINAIN